MAVAYKASDEFDALFIGERTDRPYHPYLYGILSARDYDRGECLRGFFCFRTHGAKGWWLPALPHIAVHPLFPQSTENSNQIRAGMHEFILLAKKKMEEQIADVYKMVEKFKGEEWKGYELTLATEKDKYSGEHGVNTCLWCKTDNFNAYIQCFGCDSEHNTFYSMCTKCFTSRFAEARDVPGELHDYGGEKNLMFHHDPGKHEKHKKYVCGFRFYTPDAMKTDFFRVWKGCEEAMQALGCEDST